MIKTKNCPICSKSINSSKIVNINYNTKSFYEKYLKLYFKNKLKIIKTIQCKNCFSYINNYWFTNDDLFKIYNIIYPQHHRGWKNFYNFKSGKYSDEYHYKILQISKLLKPKTYAEFNCPFSGIFLNLLSKDYKKKQIKKLLSNSIEILKVNQLANKETKYFQTAIKKFNKLNLNIQNLTKKKKIKFKKISNN